MPSRKLAPPGTPAAPVRPPRAKRSPAVVAGAVVAGVVVAAAAVAAIVSATGNHSGARPVPGLSPRPGPVTAVARPTRQLAAVSGAIRWNGTDSTGAMRTGSGLFAANLGSAAGALRPVVVSSNACAQIVSGQNGHVLFYEGTVDGFQVAASINVAQYAGPGRYGDAVLDKLTTGVTVSRGGKTILQALAGPTEEKGTRFEVQTLADGSGFLSFSGENAAAKGKAFGGNITWTCTSKPV